MNEILFFTLALFSVTGAVGMIMVSQPIYAALSFIVTLIALAGIYALLGNSFLFAIQIIIYAGAIVSLILFIIMFLNIKPQNLPKEAKKNRYLLLSTLAVLPFSYLLISLLSQLPLQAQTLQGDIKPIGKALFSDYILPFEMVSILLLVSLIGAVILAKKDLPPKGVTDVDK